MRLFFKLLGVQIRQWLGLASVRQNMRRRPVRMLGRLLLWFVVALTIIAMVGLYTQLISALMPAFAAIGLERILLGLIWLLAMIFVFFMGLLYLLGMLFFAKDTEFLAALPIPQRTVFAAKFAQVLLGEMAMSAVLLLPACVIYGIHVGGGIDYWLRAFAIVVATPCMPLALAGILSLALMRFGALWRRRDLLTIIGSILFIVVVIVGQSYLTSALPDDMTVEAIRALIVDSSGMLSRIVSAFPPSGWAVEGLARGGGHLVAFLGASALSLLVVAGIAGKIYYGGAMAQMEAASKSRTVTLQGSAVRARNPVYAMFLREWRTVLRSPVYALNGLITIVMGPLLLILPKFMQSSDSMELQNAFAMLEGVVHSEIIMLVLAAVFMAIAMINPAAATPLSREGKCYYLLRILPQTPQHQILAKYLFGLSIAVLAMVLMGVMAVLMFSFSLPMVTGAVAIGIVVSIGPLALSMLPDVLHPKLSWNSETEAIKQNLNAFLGMVIGWGYLVLAGYCVFRLLIGGMAPGILLAGLIVLGVLMDGLFLWGLCRAARHSWHAIEG